MGHLDRRGCVGLKGSVSVQYDSMTGQYSGRVVALPCQKPRFDPDYGVLTDYLQDAGLYKDL